MFNTFPWTNGTAILVRKCWNHNHDGLIGLWISEMPLCALLHYKFVILLVLWKHLKSLQDSSECIMGSILE